MQDAPANRIVVDLDCEPLKRATDRERCDYLFVGEEAEKVWVAPIEMKGGRVEAEKVIGQLQEGAHTLGEWLPAGCNIRFVPVLVHNGGIHKRDTKRLRRERIRLRNYQRQTVFIRCGQPLRKALNS